VPKVRREGSVRDNVCGREVQLLLTREEGVEADRELMLEDARSVCEGLWRMARLAQDAAEALDSRIEDEDLDNLVEAVEVRETLERLQALSLEVSEELDAYQNKQAP
jgi:hypothetical protein